MDFDWVVVSNLANEVSNQENNQLADGPSTLET